MNKVQSELSEREQQMLLIRRESDTKTLQLSKMEKMLAETRGKLDKKTESGTESKGRDNRDNMGLYQYPYFKSLSFFSEMHENCIVLVIWINYHRRIKMCS